MDKYSANCSNCNKELGINSKYRKVKLCRSCVKKGIRNGMFNKIGWNAKEKHPFWSDNPSYRALHKRIQKELGTIKKCTHCGTETAKLYHWANKSHKYEYNLKDWIRLCVKCHWIFDKRFSIQENMRHSEIMKNWWKQRKSI